MDKDNITILMADDDEEDRFLAKEAFGAARLNNDLRFVENGEQLLDYLKHRNEYEGGVNVPRPGLILLDLNMPVMSGHEALTEIKADPLLRDIPVVVLTTSSAEEDILRSYELGVNSFISKPVTFDGLVSVIQETARYWFQIVELPRRRN